MDWYKIQPVIEEKKEEKEEKKEEKEEKKDKKDKKDKKKSKKHHKEEESKTAAMIDSVVENRQKIAEMGQAILSDEKQRDEMIEKVKDAIFDFLLKVGVRGVCEG